MSYGLDALRRLRDRQQRAGQDTDPNGALTEVPPDAPYDEPEKTVHAWTGERFVPLDAWLASTPVEAVVERQDAAHAVPAGATCIIGDCGGTCVWLVKDGERWLMYVGTRKSKGRRRDFASPFLEHAIATAEWWYGAPAGSWRPEKNSNGSSKAQDLYPQAEDEHEGSTRGNDELALDGR